jgi:Leucine-rich repeat (LRR) protein
MNFKLNEFYFLLLYKMSSIDLSNKAVEALISYFTDLSNKCINSIEEADIQENVEELYLSSNNIKYLKGIEKFTNLTYLIIDNNQITSLAGIENLVNLTVLRINNNKITSLIGIEKLVKLTILRINNNKITSLVGIEKLVNLTYLIISHNQLTSLVGIEQLVNLKELYISHNQITSLAGIEKLVDLRYLNISNNPLVPIDKYNLIKYIRTRVSIDCGEQAEPQWGLTYNYWQIKKYPQHLKQLIFDYYKLYFTNKYKNELIKNKWIKQAYNL